MWTVIVPVVSGLVAGVWCSPIDVSKISADLPIGNLTNVFFLTNINGIKDETAENLDDMFYDDILENAISNETVVAVMFVVEDKNSQKPVNLDLIADDAERQGFIAEKFKRHNETRLVKLSRSLTNLTETNENDVIKVKNQEEETFLGGKLLPSRTKRSLKMSFFKGKKGGGGGGGGCNTCGQTRTAQVYVVPVYTYTYTYSQPQQNYCDPCARHG